MAWAISNAEDTQVYTTIFKAINARVPDAAINTLMSDDGDVIPHQ